MRTPADDVTETSPHDAEGGVAPELIPAYVTAARYEIGEEIARGGGGHILRARDARLGRDVVVKIPLRDQPSGRFAREAAITAQLEHPAIVPVHVAGELPDGTPFYVMKLLSGRSLRDVIDQTPDLDARLALLPRVLRVCEAVAYAHSKRVVHRDLKPHNVLVGEFGETTVVDWGVAKRLGEDGDASAGSAPATAPAAPAEADELTRVGTVLGTPAYMAPEQARGEPVDERADVYALGALLYHVCAGVHPYAGGETGKLLERVREDSPPDLKTREPGTPSEILDIVRKAMARDPAARYPTARELADDLDRHLAGRLVAAHFYSRTELLGRWLRRHSTQVIASLIALAAIGATIAVAFQRVLDEAHRANQQRAAAEDLVQFMLVDLGGRLKRVGRLDVLDGVAGQADQYYRRIEGAATDVGAAALERREQAFSILADVRESEGKIKAALVAAGESVLIQRALAAVAPGDDARAALLAQRLSDLAKLQVTSGDLAAGRKSFEEAMALVDGGLRRAPNDYDWRKLRQRVLWLVAKLDGDERKNDAALRGYAEAFAVQDELARVRPDDEELAVDRAAGDAYYSVRLHAAHDDHRALEIADTCREVAGRFLARDAGDVSWRLRLAACDQAQGSALMVLDRSAEAIQAQTRSRDAYEIVSGRDPENSRWAYLLSKSNAELAQAQIEARDFAGAHDSVKRAAESAARLVAKEPDRPQWLLQLWYVTMMAGEADREAHPADALAAYQRALEVAVKLDKANPGSVHYAKNVGMTLWRVGELMIQLGDRPGGAAKIEESIARLDDARKRAPRESIDALCDAHADLADAKAADADWAAALDHLRAAVSLEDESTRAGPVMQERRSTLATRHARLAGWLEAHGGAAGEVALHRSRALELLEALGRERALTDGESKLLKDLIRSSR